MADLILPRECLTVRLPASIVTTGLFTAGVSGSGNAKARDRSPAPRVFTTSAVWRLLCHGYNSQKIPLRRTAILTPQQPECASRSGAVCGGRTPVARPGLL